MLSRSHARAVAAALAACLVLLLGVAPASQAATPALSGADALAQSRAKYAALKTYADTGTVTTQYEAGGGPPLIEHHSFRTVYAAPRKFQLDFRKGGSGERLVIWGDGENFHTWWSETKVHELYPRGQGANAFALSSLPTLGAAMAIPPLLFSQAGLHGALSDFELIRSAGIEKLDGRTYYKLVGHVGLAYGTGAVRGGRPTTIWIDTETLLVGLLLEDTAEDAAAGSVDRVTTRFQGQADPAINPGEFNFAVPPG